MTQAIINNAAAIAFNRDLTVASTTSQSRRTKWFRKGPIQSTADVTLNVLTRSTWQPILGTLSSNLLGPYDLQFPEEVVGSGSTHTITVNGADQLDTDQITVSSTANQTIATAGSLIKFPGVKQSFVLTADLTTNSSGVGTASLDNPVPSAPTNSGTVNIGADITFSMLLIERPQTSYGPTGLVANDGNFRFVEDV